MNLPAYIQTRADGVHLRLKIQPRASRSEIAGVLGGELRITVTAPPVDAAANEAVLRLLADELDCPRGAVQLVRGATSRHKVVRIVGIGAEEIAKRLS